jgi:predicted nucleic acid-binding protein
MAVFVIDASATLPWCFEDETTPWTEMLLDSLRGGAEAIAPAHWMTEVSNAMCMAVRRHRLAPHQPRLLLDLLAALPISIEPPLTNLQARETVELAMRLGLTVYDGAYLELAKRRGVTLATLDQRLRAAATNDGVEIYDPMI